MHVLICDDQRLFADSLRKALSAEQEEISVTVASDGKDALKEIRADLPDVVLMDIHMPVMNGIEATRLIHDAFPSIKILMLTAFGYDEYVKEALANGAVGYLLKDISSDELLSAIHAACNGVRIISPQALDGISALRSRRSPDPVIPDWYRNLTARERDILVLVMKGFSNDEIADKVCLSLQTVKNYLSSIYSKLNVKSRFQAMRLAMEYRIDAFRMNDSGQ